MAYFVKGVLIYIANLISLCTYNNIASMITIIKHNIIIMPESCIHDINMISESVTYHAELPRHKHCHIMAA